ncbi:MAG: type II toxin-antitoxin system RelE/ParE family toxin, partial [Desulfamplus sp.]|nr:type II toxin-antitoxin system RelE/ParE family toxin [Desulfamplus sp.]
MKIHTSALFRSQKNKLGKVQLEQLNTVVEKIKNQPELGTAKTGDLQGVYTYIYNDGLGKVLLGYRLYNKNMKIKLITLSRIS